MAMKYVKVFYDWKEQTAELTDEEFGSLIRALICYVNEEEPEELTGAARILFPMFRRFVDFETEAYEKKVKQCREAGKKSGIARKRNEKERARTKVNEMNEEEVKEKVQAKDEEDEEVNDLFYQDQEEEDSCGDLDMNDDLERINNFIIEKGLNCDAQEFYDYYSERNWEIGGKKIDDWKGLLVSWDKSNRVEPLKSVSAPPKKKDYSSFDTDDFFAAALARKYEPKSSPR